MEHLPEILKIVDGGLRRDGGKVARYAELLASKLESAGEESAADKLRRVLSAVQSNAIHAASFTNKLSPPVDGESRVAIADVTYPSIEEVPLVLSGLSKDLVDGALEHYRRSGELIKHGAVTPGHMLLFGPPGCGKTQVAKYLAANLGLPLITARLDGLISSFLGSTAKNVRALFEFVDQTPCVLLLDEFDALAKMRDDPHELGELKRVVNSLLQNIDALPPGTIVVAATNHDHLLDPAVWRRFEFHVPIDLPDADGRLRLLQTYLPSARLLKSKDAKILAALTQGSSAAEIKRLCDALTRDSVLNGKKRPDMCRAAQLVWTSQLAQPTATRGDVPDDLEGRIWSLRSLDPKLFTYATISRLLGVSTGKISNVLSGVADGRE